MIEIFRKIGRNSAERVASNWQDDDFALRVENFQGKPTCNTIVLESIARTRAQFRVVFTLGKCEI